MAIHEGTAQRAWAHLDAFRRVAEELRRKGWTIPSKIEHELITEFLVHRVRELLATYASERVTPECVLAIAFRNFMISELRTRRYGAALWGSRILCDSKVDRKVLDRLGALLISYTVAPEHLSAIQALIRGGSVRAAACDLGTSAWETRKRINDALMQFEDRHLEEVFGVPGPPRRPD